MTQHTDGEHFRRGFTRRELLRASAAAAVGAATGALGVSRQAKAAIRPLAIRPPVCVAVAGVPRNAPFGALSRAIREAALAATDFTWLAPRDRVLLKVMCNSPNPYPATTHPVAVTVMADLLRERGASVYVGDQSGVESVHHTRQRRRGSTRANFRNNGLQPAAQRGGAAIACFEEAGYDAYFAAEPLADGHYRVFVSYVWGVDQFTAVESYNAPRLKSPWSCRILTRGCELFGGRPESLAIENVNDSVPPTLLRAVTRRAAYPA